MGKSYSLDLRERIVARVAACGSRRGAARHFGVSDSCAVKLLARVGQTGSAEPARQGRPPGGGKLAAHRGFLVDQVQGQAGHHHAGTGGAAEGRAWGERQSRLTVPGTVRGGVHI